MGFYFRKSVNFGPLRFNFSKSGIGASVGIKGARLTMTPRGATYITAGTHGFYYRQTLSHGDRVPLRSSDAPATGPGLSSRPDNIPTADPSMLVESSSEKLIRDLNTRAKMLNPAWVLYAFALFLGLGAIAALSDEASLVEVPSLPDVTRPLGPERRANTNDEYALLVARYGQPDSVLLKNQAGIPVRVMHYNSASVEIALVPNGCVEAYGQAVIELGTAQTHSRPRRGKAKPVINCTLNDGFTIVDLLDSITKYILTADTAKLGLDKILAKRTAQPAIQVESSERPAAKSGRFAQRQTTPSNIPFDSAQLLAEQRRMQQVEVQAKHDRCTGAGLLLIAFGLFAGAVVVHKKSIERRKSRLFYELGETAQQQYSLVQQAVKHLSSAHRIWRVESKTLTSDLKRHAGASTLVSRVPASASTANPPRVEVNLAVPCLKIGLATLFFLPDLVLYWERGSFGAIPYEDFRIQQYSTRFVEDNQLPADAVILEKTWRYVNKNGGPDRRFNNNVQLPVVQYGALVLTSSRGLNIHLQTSNPRSSLAFSNCFDELASRNRPASERPSKKDRESKSGNRSEALATPEATALKTLGLGAGCSLADLSAAYRRLAQMYHPDKVSTLGPELRELAERRMKELNAAYEFLKHRQPGNLSV